MTVREEVVGSLLETARREVGTERLSINNVKYNTSFYGHPVSGEEFKWCVVFIWWCMQKTRVPMDVFLKTARVFTVRDWYKAQGRFFEAPTTPKKGDLVVYSYSHIGIVAQLLPDDRFLTIEGNQGDAVRKLIHRLDESDIEGYCRPAYHLVEADMTKDEMLDALESARGKQIIQDALKPIVRQEVLDILRAGFGGLGPDPASETVRDSQRFLFESIEEINSKLVG
jgi:hypothetical protein